MTRLLSSLGIGAVFGLGIAISGMANPAKVLNFFDLFGTWDPSLIFVMGGALITTAIGYRIVFANRQKPAMEPTFELPKNKVIDSRLVAGSATFGVGWGVAGFCPGGAIPALGLGYSETLIFVAAMIIGIIGARQANKRFQESAILA
ncbi:UNVERIFIED_CONTAM: hypothetical protein GTU68_006232 [Idotea baltica]|nr:hypothetical protein [Idotea baltica]